MARPTAASIKAKVNATMASNNSPTGNYSSSSSISNTGEMSTQTATSGAKGAAINTTNIRVQGDPGFSLGQDSEVIAKHRAMLGL